MGGGIQSCWGDACIRHNWTLCPPMGFTGGPGEEKGWRYQILHGLPQIKRTDQEGLVSFTTGRHNSQYLIWFKLVLHPGAQIRYWQVEVEEQGREKTTFTADNGLWQFNVMAFGGQYPWQPEVFGLSRWHNCTCKNLWTGATTFDSYLLTAKGGQPEVKSKGVWTLTAQGQVPWSCCKWWRGCHRPWKNCGCHKLAIAAKCQRCWELSRAMHLLPQFVLSFADVARPLHKLTEKG